MSKKFYKFFRPCVQNRSGALDVDPNSIHNTLISQHVSVVTPELHDYFLPKVKTRKPSVPHNSKSRAPSRMTSFVGPQKTNDQSPYVSVVC